MKKVYLTLKLTMVAILLSISVNSFSQGVYSTWGLNPTGYTMDTCYTYGDTMRFTFSGIPAGVYGTVKMVVYYQGDHGIAGLEESENFLSATPGGPNIAYLGNNGPHPSGSDCMPEDSTILYFSSSLIIPLGSTFYTKNIPMSSVDFFCTGEMCRIRLEVTYCTAGTPVQYAEASVSDNTVCPYETVTLSGIPVGGTWAGPGVSGSTFDPSSLAAGTYTVTYTGTDAIGCTTQDDTTIKVLAYPLIDDYIVCYGDSAHVIPNSGSSFIYYTDAALTDVIDTIFALDYGPITSTQTIYALDNDEDYAFRITSMLNTSSVIVDHNTLAGDDRGGIAVTPNYVYINGDAACVRYDLALTPGSGTALPQRDGIFSDLYSGRLYTLWNTTTSSEPTFAPGSFTVEAFMEMDDALNFTGAITTLSMPINLNYGSRIFAGAGIVIFWNGTNNHFYVVDVNTGETVDLGVAVATPPMYGTENWLAWGIAEYDGSTYSIVYRSNSGQMIDRMDLSSGAITNVATFSNLSDMASITYSRWEDKWYWHYEGSGEWGGSAETLGKLDGTHALTVLSSTAGAGCYTDVMLTVPAINIGTDVYFCQGNEAEFSVGLGYSSISWNGNNSDLNTYSSSASEQVIIEAVETSTGCTVMDTANAVMNPLPTVTFNLTDDHACITQTSFPLAGGTPAGGVYSGGFVSGSNFNATSAGNGTHIVTYTFIDANGCVNFAQDAVFVDACVGVDEVGNNLVTIYPNPANNHIVINAGSFVSQPVNIDIYDAQGKVVYTEKTTLVSNHEINVSNLENGVYHLILSVDGNRSIGKLVIQK